MTLSPEIIQPDLVQSDLEQFAASQRRLGVSSRIAHGLEILWHYRWVQIGKRAASVLRNRRARKIEVDAVEDFELRQVDSLQVIAKLEVEFQKKNVWRGGSDINNGLVTVLNESCDLGPNFDWDRVLRKSHLWRFQFQYHEFLLTEPQSAVVEVFLTHWLERFQPNNVTTKDDAWHPYCLSRRIPTWAWLILLDQFPRTADSVSRALYQQIDYLHRNLERDLGGNHLFENLVALVIGGVLFSGEAADGWLATAETELKRELPRQVLKHGEHFELAPMYHCQVLGGLLKIVIATQEVRPDLAEFCLGYANQMMEFIEGIVHPDQEIPLFGDSGYGEAPSIAHLRVLWQECKIRFADQVAELAKDQTETPATGPKRLGDYHIWDVVQRGEIASRMICDFGPAAARGLPAHAHCDVLGLEASVGGTRWFVDSGNYNYGDDSMRAYCRSSIAHNVVTIAGRNQCNVWSKFRMGRRAKVTHLGSGADENWSWAEAKHNGYQTQTVQRKVGVSTCGNYWVCCDWIPQNTMSPIVGFLHLHPQVQLAQDKTEWRRLFLKCQGIQRQIVFFGVTAVNLRQGWYCPAFGHRVAASVIEYRQEPDQNLPIGWVLYNGVSPRFRITKGSLFMELPGGVETVWDFE